MKDRNRSTRGQGFVEYALIIVLAVLAVILVLNIFGVNVKQVYTDLVCTFSGGAGSEIYKTDKGWGLSSDWQDVSGGLWKNSWATTPDGYLVGNVDGKKGGDSAMLLDQDPGADFTMDLNLGTITNTTEKNPNATVDNGYGIFFRATEPSKLSGYSLEVSQAKGGEPPYLYFRRWDNGNQIGNDTKGYLAKAVVPAGFDLSNPGTLTLSVVGDTFTASINGKQVMQAKDSTYKEGGVGLSVNRGSTATFKTMLLASAGCGN